MLWTFYISIFILNVVLGTYQLLRVITIVYTCTNFKGKGKGSIWKTFYIVESNFILLRVPVFIQRYNLYFLVSTKKLN
jgi:hypothetical protein